PSHRPVPGRSSWSPVQRRGSGRASLSPLLLGRPQGFDDSPLLDTSSLLLGSTLVFGLPRRPAIRPADGAVSWLGSVALARWWAKAREKEMSTSHESRTSKDFVVSSQGFTGRGFFPKIHPCPGARHGGGTRSLPG